jgi:chromosomal replication initiation ATPase DnaA
MWARTEPGTQANDCQYTQPPPVQGYDRSVSGLLGREREKQALDALLESARDERSAVLVLRGEPGIGKTALLEAAREGAGEVG